MIFGVVFQEVFENKVEHNLFASVEDEEKS